MGDFLRAFDERGTDNWSDALKNTAWIGGTLEDARRYATEGDVSMVEEAEFIVGRLDAELALEDLTDAWQPSVCGVIPLVPAYLAGAPEAMLAKSQTLTDKSEVEIWVSTTVSGGVSTDEMKRRGTVLLAFAMAVQRVRPVRLVAFCESEKMAACVKMSQPLDFSEVCATFCQPSITRGLFYGFAKSYGYPGGGLKWANWAHDKTKRDVVLKSVGMADNALVLTAQRDLADLADLPEGELVKRLNDQVRALATR